MADLGVARYQRKQLDAETKGLETTTSAGQWLLANAIEPLAEALDEWMKVAKSRPGKLHRAVEYYERLDLDLAAGLIARSVLDSISLSKKMSRSCMRVAALLEDEVRFRSVAISDKGLWRKLYERTNEYGGAKTKRRHIIHGLNKAGVRFQPWPKEDKMQVGMVALDLMSKATGLIEIKTRTTMFKMRRTEVVATESAMKWLRDCHARSSLLTPLYLPCVEEPLHWTDPLHGGFHTDLLHKRALIKTYDSGYVAEIMDHAMPEVYDAVNTLQSTPFTINEEVLTIMQEYWEADNPVGGLPLRSDEAVPERPEDIDTNKEARKAWRRAAAAIHDHNAHTRAERLAVAKVLNMSDKFLGEHLRYVATLDWRGRVYPTAYHLHPQGPDWVKSLLLFAEGDPLSTPDAVRWFKIAGANFMGMTKKTFKEREAWVDANTSVILGCAEDPFGNRQFWEAADDPWCFLAWLLEFRKWHLEGDDHISRLPIPQDATQSGVQIMSLLLRDEVGAKATNCTPSAEPQDLYGDVALRVIAILKRRVKDDGDVLAEMWLDYPIDRSTTKRIVMTRPYSSTLYSGLRYVREWVKDHGGLPLEDDFKPCYYMAAAIWEAMDEVMSGTQRTMEWLGLVADVCVDHNIPVRWTSPVGFPVKQTYWKTQLLSIKTMIGDTLRKHSLREDLDELDRRRMRNGIAPNYVHSLDAAALMKTVILAKDKGVSAFALVHDSFATTAYWSEALASTIREAYIDIFREDVLADFKAEVECYLPDGIELPPLPSYGTLDINEISKSLYFFN